MNSLSRPWFFIALLIVFPLCGGLSAQDTLTGGDLDALHAAESFRLGIEAYNRASFNEAIYAFEQALSWKPDEALILDWLGRAYYRSGMESIALRQWQNALRIYGPSSPEAVLINGRVERVASRRSVLPLMNEAGRYVEIGHFPGSYDGITSFSRPSSVLPERDGSLWVAAYGSNEIVRLDVNGVIRSRERGPVAGFDRPFALARGLDGRLYVSEFRGGRVSVLDPNGKWLSHIGQKGISPGQLSGPAAITVDESGYLYVVEFGNRRVSKFDPDGAFINCFGTKDASFAGFLAPSGIASRGGVVYVADVLAKRIYTFDSNGLYLGILIDSGLEGPEGLRFLADGSLLVTDTKRLLSVNINTGIVRQLSASGNSSVRLIDGDMDSNGGLVAANFDSDEVDVLASIDDIASSLFVLIDRVINAEFPKITVELRVEDSRRRPIVGLNELNFMLTEEGRPVKNQSLISSGNAAEAADVSILIERSPETAPLGEGLAAAMLDINAALEGSGGIVSIISAGEEPVRERFNPENPASLAGAAREGASAFSQRWRFDLALRLAATDLLDRSPKRSVLFVCSGKGLGPLAFEQYSLSELAAYMANNGIVFHAIIVGGESGAASAGEEIRFLCAETGGEVAMLYRPEGLSPLIKRLVSRPSGSYFLNYESSLATDFGRAFLPVEAEVYLLERSGRDAVGYFPPLE
ncbi:MAG: 6-bladed beta-propeller [Spirochaetaceae bacterium]|jgi:DNA-binding beta-propeller fold protein YncE|nr:6-bladed beta-propeller [Spirochaetaceae bacterium]